MIVPCTAVMILVAAGASAADSPAGHYVLRGVHEVGSEILLKPDGKFEFALAYGAADFEASGTWKVDGDAVVLTTDGLDEPAFELAHSAASQEKGVRVHVKGTAGHPAAGLDVVLRTESGDLFAGTDEQGVAAFEPKSAIKAAYFRVRMYDYQAGPFPLNPAHNQFEFTIHSAVISRVPFRGERLKINGKTLEMRFFDPKQTMNYEKQ